MADWILDQVKPDRKPILIEVRGEEIPYEQFTFPDGQRHIKLSQEILNEQVDITASIRSADILFDLLLIKDVLVAGENELFLHIEYLLGARMDRAIDSKQPETLQVVAQMLNSDGGFDEIDILHPHSERSLAYLPGSVASWPIEELKSVLATFDSGDDPVIALPDMGATYHITQMLESIPGYNFVQCWKERDSQTGKLSGFSISEPDKAKGKRVLIVDDLCDGGGTFVGLAKKLREAGAIEVSLFVTHGLFTKGKDLEGIDNVFSTESVIRRESSRRTLSKSATVTP